MKKINIQITDEPILTKEMIGNEKLLNLLESGNELSANPSFFAEMTLKKAIKRYPNVPAFYNYLVIHYFRKGKKKKAFDLNKRVREKFPDYLFGRTAEVDLLLQEEEFDEQRVRELLGGEEFDIRNVVASDKKIFHVSEVIAYYGGVLRYYLKMGAIDQAKSYLAYFLSEPLIGGEHEKVRFFAEMIMRTQIEQNLLLNQKRQNLNQRNHSPRWNTNRRRSPPS